MVARCALFQLPFWLCLLSSNVVVCMRVNRNSPSVDALTDQIGRTQVSKRSNSLGRILTWNVKKLGACLQQDNVDQLKEVICVILQSANLIVLQEASNLDFSCLPCSSALKDDYVWRAEGDVSEDFQILVKTKQKKSIRVIKEGTCKVSMSLPAQTVMPAPDITANPVIKETLTTKATNTHNTVRDNNDEPDNAHELIDKLLVDYIQSKDFVLNVNKTEKNNNTEESKSTLRKEETSTSKYVKDDKFNDKKLQSSSEIINTSDRSVDLNGTANDDNNVKTVTIQPKSGKNINENGKESYSNTNNVESEDTSDDKLNNVKSDHKDNSNGESVQQEDRKQEYDIDKDNEKVQATGVESSDDNSKSKSKATGEKSTKEKAQDDSEKPNSGIGDSNSEVMEAKGYDPENPNKDGNKNNKIKAHSKPDIVKDSAKNDNTGENTKHTGKGTKNDGEITKSDGETTKGTGEITKSDGEATKGTGEAIQKFAKPEKKVDELLIDNTEHPARAKEKHTHQNIKPTRASNDSNENLKSEKENTKNFQEINPAKNTDSKSNHTPDDSEKGEKVKNNENNDRQQLKLNKNSHENNANDKGNLLKNEESQNKDGFKSDENKRKEHKENNNPDDAVYVKDDRGNNSDNSDSKKISSENKETTVTTHEKQNTRHSDESGDSKNIAEKHTNELEDTPIVLLKEKSSAKASSQSVDDPIVLLKEIQSSIKQLKDTSNSKTARPEKPEQANQKVSSNENASDNIPNRDLKEKEKSEKYVEIDVNGLHIAYVNSLKSRLLRSKARLQKLDVNNDKFKTIDNQIRFIERELTQLDARPKLSEQSLDGNEHLTSETNGKDVRPDKQSSSTIEPVRINGKNFPTAKDLKVEKPVKRHDDNTIGLKDTNTLNPTAVAFQPTTESENSEDVANMKSVGDKITKSKTEEMSSAEFVEPQQILSGNERTFLKKVEDYKARNDEEKYEENSESRAHHKTIEIDDSLSTSPFRRLDLDSDNMHKFIREIIIGEMYGGDKARFNKEMEKYDGNDKEIIKTYIKDKTRKYLEDKILGKIRNYGSKLKRDIHSNGQLNVRFPRNVQPALRSLTGTSTNQVTLNHSKRHSKHNSKPMFFHDFEVSKRDFTATPNIEMINYELLSVTSDLNGGQPFFVINVRLPKVKILQASCIEAIKSDVKIYNQDKRAVFIMGDFHLDKMSSADPYDNFNLYQVLANLQINGENFHSPITYRNKDPITTVFGRRYDNIVTNVNLRQNVKLIGPEFPMVLDTLVLPLTIQRLYNNYITALYNTDGNAPESIYDCLKAYQTNGEKELQNNVCSDSWVPSSYISDHLPLQLTIKMAVKGRVPPVELKVASWNVQGDTLKERLLDPTVKKKFVEAIKKYHVLIFNYFLPGDETLNIDDLPGDIIRLKQGPMTTDFSIYISDNVKDKSSVDNDSEMFVMKKKNNNNINQQQQQQGATAADNANLISTVGLFTPSIKVDGEGIKGCFYTVRNNGGTISVDFKKIMDAINKDAKARLGCDFKILFASLYLDGSFNLDKELYNNYKYINMNCQIVTKDQKKYRYNVPRSRDLTDFIILLENQSNITFSDCTIGLPGDEMQRGVEKLSDFEELSTHYPLSMVVRDLDAG